MTNPMGIWDRMERVPEVLKRLHERCIAYVPTSPDGYKSDDGTVTIELPSYSRTLSKIPEVVHVFVRMYCVGPSRTYKYTGKTLLEAVESADRGMAEEIRKELLGEF